MRYCLRRVKIAEHSRKSQAVGDDRNPLSENDRAIEHPQESKISSEPIGCLESGYQNHDQARLNRGQQPTHSQEPPRRTAADTANITPGDAELGGRLIADEIRRELPCGYRTQFIAELKTAPDALRRAEFQAQAPLPGEAFGNRDRHEVIRTCRPEEPEMKSMVDWVNYCFRWFSRWVQRLLPDSQTRQAAIRVAEAILLSEDRY